MKRVEPLPVPIRIKYVILSLLMPLGVGYVILGKRLSNLQDPANAVLVFVVLAVSFWPFYLASAWHCRTLQKEGYAGATFWVSARELLKAGFTGRTLQKQELESFTDHGTVQYDPFIASLRALIAGVLVFVFVWLAGTQVVLGRFDLTLLLGLVLAVLMWSITICLEHARPYLAPAFYLEDAARPMARRYSWNPLNYQPPGRRWYWLAVTLAIAWMVVAMGAVLMVVGGQS